MYAKMIMYKDMMKFVEGHKQYYGCDLKVQKTPGDPGTTLSKSNLEKPDNINKYRSFVEQLMWYKTKVGTDAANRARELAVHIIHPGKEHRKAL